MTEFRTNNTNGEIQWEGRNDMNEKVASGYYLYKVENLNSGNMKQGELAIVR